MEGICDDSPSGSRVPNCRRRDPVMVVELKTEVPLVTMWSTVVITDYPTTTNSPLDYYSFVTSTSKTKGSEAKTSTKMTSSSSTLALPTPLQTSSTSLIASATLMATLTTSSISTTGGHQTESSSPASTSNISQHTSNSGGTPIKGAAIAGIVIGSLAVLVIVAVLFFFWGRRKVCGTECQATGTSSNIEAGLGQGQIAELGVVEKDAGSGSLSITIPGGAPVQPHVHPSYPHYESVVLGELEANEVRYTPLPINPTTTHHENTLNKITLAELPSSKDPGNSPLPEYDDIAGRQRVFSWAASETFYRPGGKARGLNQE
ncbi:hypothetical protein PT974_10405 [Cladobotryum mycophilum]|uniref:Mid2 domain-containing protein n=1 Tax=Cladobotryum mycophilum TaxID=491253 RepID=A0ABR0S9S3_9HYPO